MQNHPQKGFATIIAFIVLLLTLGGTAWYFMKFPAPRVPAMETQKQVKTMTNETGGENKKTSPSVLPTSAIEVENSTIVVNPEDKNCSLDSDCALFQPDCEDCKIETTNKKSLSKYNDAKNEYCSINKAKTQCDLLFTGKFKCINNTCVATR